MAGGDIACPKSCIDLPHVIGVGLAADVSGNGSLGLSPRVLTSRARLLASENGANGFARISSVRSIGSLVGRHTRLMLTLPEELRFREGK